jgi:hypothetical protein
MSLFCEKCEVLLKSNPLVCPYERKKGRVCLDSRCWESRNYLHLYRKPGYCRYGVKCWSRSCQRLHPFQERLATLRQNKEKNQCPKCGTTQEPITGSARELTNPENRSGQIVTICPLCEYVYGVSF